MFAFLKIKNPSKLVLYFAGKQGKGFGGELGEAEDTVEDFVLFYFFYNVDSVCFIWSICVLDCYII